MTTCFRTSCVWLDWIDHWNFTLVYELFHIWYSPTTHKTSIQLMLISFVWLYMFKCDVYAQILADQTQKDFWVFYMCFESDFILSCFSSKIGSEEVSLEARDLELPAKCTWGKLKSHIFIQKLSLLPREYFATKHFSRNGF